MIPKHKFKSISGVRDFSVCEDESIFLVLTYELVKIYLLDILSPIHCLKMDSNPKIAKLSPNGKYFLVYMGENSITIYNTKNATPIQRIIELPIGLKNIRFSKQSHKIVYGSTQMLCIWNIYKSGLEMQTRAWKNINCYDINPDGSQVAIGNYNGTISVVTMVADGKCNQILIKRHSTCITNVCFHEKKLISVSFDGQLIITTIEVQENGERLLTYIDFKTKSLPREIESVGNRFYMFDQRGVTWFDENFVQLGLVDSNIYKPIFNQDKELIFVKLVATEMEWWDFKVLMGES